MIETNRENSNFRNNIYPGVGKNRRVPNAGHNDDYSLDDDSDDDDKDFNNHGALSRQRLESDESYVYDDADGDAPPAESRNSSSRRKRHLGSDPTDDPGSSSPDDDNYNTADDYDIDDDDDDDDDDNDDVITDDDEEHDDSESSDSDRHSPLAMMFGMMLNPVDGWKKIRRSRTTPEQTAAGCFYPLLAIAAAACFVECFYNTSVTLSDAMLTAVKTFVALFFGNFLILMGIKMFMPGKFKKIADSAFCKSYVMYLLSTLALFRTLYECLPMIGPVLFFLPLWTVYLAIRGARFFRFPPEKSNLLITILCILTLMAPFLVYQIFDMFM
ncbi:MAG: hypothetical protein K2I48_08505 [Muribaculaceae bacterium]|nr:hypothetical protein [Muribaculaceae bacterium]